MKQRLASSLILALGLSLVASAAEGAYAMGSYRKLQQTDMSPLQIESLIADDKAKLARAGSRRMTRESIHAPCGEFER